MFLAPNEYQHCSASGWSLCQHISRQPHWLGLDLGLGSAVGVKFPKHFVSRVKPRQSGLRIWSIHQQVSKHGNKINLRKSILFPHTAVWYGPCFNHNDTIWFFFPATTERWRGNFVTLICWLRSRDALKSCKTLNGSRSKSIPFAASTLSTTLKWRAHNPMFL